ncbi:Aste57867_22575 [Aphanomyces stellatus]|uniref:Serine/threonine-protein kinase ATR n=1 Tax=Aphanomyces stellatus TaxID=120398 RepID=A0A485LM86_9STRA|nr:hypothetical protein As57867_022505 [Aphanomyces stellatus]VFT99233.1 Aste57867_22575 [Aphanomyces stellatus]
MLPKVMKEISTSAPNQKVLATLCTLLSLFLSSDVCPYSPSVFSSNAGVILFYMVRFLATAEYNSLHPKVFDVCVTLALLMLEYDSNGYVHIFQDLVSLLEDLHILETHKKWRQSESVSVYCFLVSGTHLGRDTSHMQNGLQICCQRDNPDPNCAEVIADLGKKTVPPLTFSSVTTVRLFRIWMWRFINKVIQYAAPFISHQASMVQLCNVTIIVMKQSNVDPSIFDVMYTLLKTSHLTEFSKCELSVAFFSFVEKSSGNVENAPRLIQVISDNVFRKSKECAQVLWKSFYAVAKNNITDENYFGSICSVVRSVLVWKESTLVLPLLLEVLFKCNLDRPDVQQEIIETIRSSLNPLTFWADAKIAIGQFHTDYIPNMHKRQKVDEYSSSIKFKDYAQVILSKDDLDYRAALVQMVLSLTYDNSYACIGLSIIFSVRSEAHVGADESEVMRMICDRMRILFESNGSMALSILALRYLRDEELKFMPLIPYLTQAQKSLVVSLEIDFGPFDFINLCEKMQNIDWLHSSTTYGQFLFVLCWVWTRHETLALREATWYTTLSARYFLEQVSQKHQSAINLAPFLAFTMCQSRTVSFESVWFAFLDILLPLSSDVTLSSVVVAALAKYCCCMAFVFDPSLSTKTRFNEITKHFVNENVFQCRCGRPPRLKLPQSREIIVQVENLAVNSSDSIIVQQALLAMVVLMKHLPVNDIPPSFAWKFLDVLGNSNSCYRHIVAANIGVILPLLEVMFTETNAHHDNRRLFGIFNTSLKNPELAPSACKAMAALGICCDLDKSLELDVFFMLLFRLLAVWKHSATSTKHIIMQDLNNMVSSQKLTWKQLCLQFPEHIHVALVELFLPDNSLAEFLATFLGSEVDLSVYAKENASHVLPHLIVTKNVVLLEMFASAYGSGATVAALVGENILAIVKEMLMQKVTSFNNVAEWEFFFGFIPNDVGIRDVIQHKPLTIIYALAWELAGDRPKVAKKSFIEVCKQFLDDEDHGNGSEKFHISQQFFLAVMTFLGQKLMSKNNRNCIRAIQCTEVLLSLFDTIGDLDNFVPKIMATLKLASQEANEENILAACQAWRTFVRLLSPDAIKSNVLSIVVSLLPCIEPIQVLFQAHVLKTETIIFNKKSQKMALEVLRLIFLEPSSLKDPSVYFLLSLVPSVAEIPLCIKNQPIHEVIQQILPLLRHWDGAVREVGLLHLTNILNSRSREVQDLILSLDEGLVHSCILGLLKELLQLSRLETHEMMQVLVAQALGALGAIDMARITPQAIRSDTTSELSTKNLACHLIQTLLVKELRAAPQNTDVIALSIQQLLQFLAQLNSSSTDSSAATAPSPGFVPSTSTMPEWMQRQFHSKGVDKIIAPYWSTKYQAPNFKPSSIPASSTFYELYGSVAYDQWLVSWCKSLIDQSTFPERNIFLACRRALMISLEMARFLLPYLVQNVLKQSSSYGMVKREIISVLQEDSLETINEAVSSHHHQCAQTVFSMLDELNEWVWANQRKKIALSQQAQITKHIDEMFDQEKEIVEEFLKDIPLSLLSSAAFKIKAYARAIQYFESHLRQQGGTSVKMTSNDISKMQQMYGSLEEPDALLGLAIQRRWLHPQPTGSFQELKYSILEHEHLARWEDALACYEQAIHHIHGADVEVEIRSLLYSGVIKCMIQLGRLEGALQHVRGIVNQYPDVIPAVYPCALECAWRLSRWDLLTELTTDAMKVKIDNEHVMGMKFAKAILCFHQDQDNMHLQLKEARLAIMGPLAAASQESYQRVYPLLHQLHFLHELEQGFLVSKATNKAQAWPNQCPWNRRNSMMAPALKFQEPVLALRRVMLEELQLDRSIISSNWLQYGKMARKEGLLRTAESAIMHAQALGNRNAIIQQAKLMVERGKIYEALHVLEPIPVDLSRLKKHPTDNHFHAKTLLLATNYMQQSSQKQGQHVIERYKSVIEFDKDYAKGYFCMAKYYEVLLENDRRGEDDCAGDPYGYLPHVLQNYVLSLKGSDKYLFQSLPRLLTLWYEFGEILQSNPKRTYRLEIDQDGDRLMQQISKIILDALHSLPESMWLVCFPQVTSRICHPNPTVVEGVKAIMVRVLITFPQRAMWYVLGLAQSLNTQRKSRAIEILKVAQKQLSSSSQVDMANALSEGMRLVEELIRLAEFDPGNQKKMPIRLTRVRAKVLLPIQNVINRRDLPESDVYIKSFGDKADVMLTKEKPKRIQIQGTDGKTYAFLCKREKHGDLRKDARMMEFNTLMNKLLQRETDGRKRKLRLRTYAVICLNEESGLMEWVPDTRTMRHLISQIYKTEQGFLQPVRLTTDIKDSFLNMQKQYTHDLPKMTMLYRSKILCHPAFTPRFHQWFLNNFSDPTAWYEARDMFVRSAAVWSMVGHIVGLGDRHGENILIDCTTGECVHVDFDCLFDKGLKLARPEIVPFRLTPNMVDAFGLSGVEGVYRHSAEVTLTLLRANRETLRSVLESFLHDPLVEWGRSKSKQVLNSSSIKTTANEQVNSEAKTMLKTIDDRLRGIWNLGKKQQHETLPLSVKGQVDRLISEATSDENLAQMYIGWMPFL